MIMVLPKFLFLTNNAACMVGGGAPPSTGSAIPPFMLCHGN